MYKVARVGLHHYEEPCLSGERGSGTIFFSGCNLRCRFCQNYEISHGGKGLDISEKQLIDCMLYLQDIGAHNINLVTPSNYTNQLVNTLKIAKSTLNLPIIWNSSGYETVKNLEKLEGLADIYLPDFKYGDNALAWEYSHAKNYFEVASAAVFEMKRQCPKDEFDSDGMMKRGVIVRHLVLPDALDNTKAVLNEIARIDKNMFVSLMGQYFPTPAVENDKTLGRRLSQEEYDEATDAFFAVGLTNGFCQELESATEEYVPNFDLDELKKILKSI
ncbi:MAG: 4Fe-4S cluster-binding domain-containing protein [Firmicutes bacterium]|nr:4Fe-4S cluster-binding domain-containing protein [Bacillota bacterium]MCM1394276.1 4Fe-4S cluster-binding domain-containing protein [[Eubacterium] siraeum]